MRRLMIGSVWAYFLVLLIGPLFYLVVQSFSEGIAPFWTELTRPEALHGFLLTAEITVIVLVVNLCFGTVTALVLVRQKFPGRTFLSGLIDLPFAVSPVIAGFMLILLFGPDTILGSFFGSLGVKVLFAFPAMVLATLFATFPFVVRELTPLLQTIGTESEEAARTLGAGEWQVFLQSDLACVAMGADLRRHAHRRPLHWRIRGRARGLGEYSPVDANGHAAHLSELCRFQLYRRQRRGLRAAGGLIRNPGIAGDRQGEGPSCDPTDVCRSSMKIEVKDLAKTFGPVVAVGGVSFQVEEGELLGLLGPSGSGKTTVLRMIAGLEAPSSGDIWIDGRRVNDLTVQERNIGFVFQHYALFKHLTVYDNIAFGLRVKKWGRQAIGRSDCGATDLDEPGRAGRSVSPPALGRATSTSGDCPGVGPPPERTPSR